MPEEPRGLVVPEVDSSVIQSVPEEESVDRSHYKVWIPEPVRGNRRLRLKYGVMLEEASFEEEISKETYGSAYLEKLQQLIETEINTPIAVLLDRFFSSPHLSAGDSRQIVVALWEELDEIKSPVALVGDWLEKRDEGALNRMIHPVSKEELVDQPISEEEQVKELEELSFEDFLELL